MIMVPLCGRKQCLEFAKTGQFGFLVGPSYYDRKIPSAVPWAIDNDAFKAWRTKIPFDESAYWKALERAAREDTSPLWVIVPDVVADRDATLRNFERYAPRISSMGFKLAFAVQDGMGIGDVPDVDTVFVGGTTQWKWRTANQWCANFKTHIGRVNSLRLLQKSEDLGAVSTDGSGWFRDVSDWDRSYTGLADWLSGWRANCQMELFAHYNRKNSFKSTDKIGT